MKTLFYSIAAALLLSGCQSGKMPVTVTNPSGFDRDAEIVEVPFSRISMTLKADAGTDLIVTDDQGREVRSQVILEGKKEPVSLIFQADVPASSDRKYFIRKGVTGFTDQLAFGRFVPERMDDYAWENNRIAFRIYGTALIQKDGPSNGLDVWIKRTDSMVINNWYANYLDGINSYHNDNGQGCDCFKVGRTLGAGAMAPYVNDSLWLGINFLAYETLDNGPLRISFRLTYPPFDVDGTLVSETRTFSLDAGSQLNRVTEEYTGIDHPFAVAAGIVLRPEGKTLATSEEKGYMTYSLDTGVTGTTYLGTILCSPASEVKEASGHLLMTTTYNPGEKLIYYTGAGWNRWGFENEEAWIKYIDSYAERILNPLTISYK